MILKKIDRYKNRNGKKLLHFYVKIKDTLLYKNKAI